jgi:hypothetical protein
MGTKIDKSDIVNKILEDIEIQGMSLRKACEKYKFSSKDFYIAHHNSEEVKKQYARATKARQEKIFEDILEIADDSDNDILHTEFGEKENKEWVNRSRLRIDARKWMLGKMNPKKYGDKIDVTTDGEKVTQPLFSIQIDGKDLDLR